MRAYTIRTLILIIVPAMMLGVFPAAAQTAWQNYVSRELGLAFEAPRGIVSEIGATMRGDFVGTKEAIVFRAEENGIEYRVSVANFAQAQMMSETILGEALFLFQGEHPVLSDTFGRVGEGSDTVYGRISTIELAQGGRATTAFYFTGGKLYQLTATVAANGDYASPAPMRFIESLNFDLSETDPNAVELTLPEF